MTILSRRKKALVASTFIVTAGVLAATGTAYAIDAGALPQNGTVVSGAATFDYSVPTRLGVTQSTDRAVINWDSFNIGAKAKTEFFQPTVNSVVVNRVQSAGSDPTQILGTLKANGRLVVLDRNGVLFAKGSRVDAAGLVVSSGDFDEAEFGSSGKIILNLTDASGKIDSRGKISVADGGLAALVAPTVLNSGTITAKLGKVVLASGAKATVDLAGDGLFELAVPDKLQKALIDNTGTLSAEGGMILLSTETAKKTVDNVINLRGVADVSSATVQGGKIILNGDNLTHIKITAKVKAQGGTGGSVDVNGNDIVVLHPDTSIQTGGGNVNISAAGQFTLDDGVINAGGGNISVTTGAGFRSKADRLNTSGTGTVSVYQTNSSSHSIQNAIDAIHNTGTGLNTVDVAAGTWLENIVINDPYFLIRGAKAGVDAKDSSRGGADETVISAGGLPGVTIAADNVSLDGVTIDGASTGVSISGVSNAAVSNSIIQRSTVRGIYLNGATNAQILNNQILSTNGDGILADSVHGAAISGNKISGTVSTATDVGSGIHLLNSYNVTVGGTTLADANLIYGAGWDAVKVTGGNNILVEGNDLRDAARVGAYGKWTYAFSAVNNMISGMGMYGVRVLQTTGPTLISGNHIDSVLLDGISVQSTPSTLVSANVIGYGADGILGTADDTSSGLDGISVFSSPGSLISGNQIAHQARNGIYITKSSDVTVASNEISASAASGVQVSASSNIQLASNLIKNSGAAGFYASGQDNGLISLTGNTFLNNKVGARFETGTVDISHGDVNRNTFVGGQSGLVFDPGLKGNAAKLALVGNTIGETVFSGQSAYYVQLANKAFAVSGIPAVINGLNAVYDGLSPASVGGLLLLSQYNSINAKLLDNKDNPALGLIVVGSVAP